MKQDFTKNYERWIDGLTKDQFDSLMKVFIKEYWDVETVVITDGKGDGGIDVKIFEDKRNKKIPLQITIDKNVYTKLEKDLVKIEKLILDNDYSDNFYFFYSHGAAEAKVIELKDTARIRHSINLELFDNKRIAAHIEKPSFVFTREMLRHLLGEFVRDEDEYFDESQKLYYDYLSYADGSNQLKESFIKSFVLNYLYESEEYRSKLNGITDQINREFNINVTQDYCSRLLKELFEKGKITKCDDGLVHLSKDEITNIKSIKEDSSLLEGEFLSLLQEKINKFDSNLEIRDVVNHLKKIYESSNKIDFLEISDSIEESNISETVSQFHNYVKNCFNSGNAYKEFINEVFQLCSENTYIINLSAGNLYKNLMDNPEFSVYTRRSNKEVFIDTPVLIYLFLQMSENNFRYDNYRFKVTTELNSIIQKNDNYINFNTTQLYITELADHIARAIKLIELDNLGIFDILGGSNNEIVNLYEAAKKEAQFEEGLKEFIESYGISIDRVDAEDDNEYLNQYLTKLFKDNYVKIDDVPPYNKNYQTKKDYDRIEKTLADVYSRYDIDRKPRSLLFDALLVEHINEFQDELIDPTIITWDKSFQFFRKEFHPKNPNFKYWHLFTPGKFIDHLSLLQFKINGSVISKEILALIETEYDVVEGIRKLSDVLSSIVDLKSASGVKLSKGLADMRETYIYQINKEQNIKIDNKETQPIDNVFLNVVDYYYDKEGVYGFNDLHKVLSIDNVVQEFLKLIQTEADYFIKYNKYSSNYKSKFDEVISKNIDQA
ncbi:hypothetical protein [Gaetbulibacter jejuensis]|uniref:Restriction endonuclease n=1 Tax=Gaetbulibacter jejuensis TaxID=584607 RepID=A0ABP3V574_9FLAO